MALLPLIAAIKGIISQFESHKDLVTALVRVQHRVYNNKQEVEISTPKFVQTFLTKAYAFSVYGGSWTMPGILWRGYAKLGFSKMNQPTAEEGELMHRDTDV